MTTSSLFPFPKAFSTDAGKVRIRGEASDLGNSYSRFVENLRFSEGDRVRVVSLDPDWPEDDRWVLGHVGTVHVWHAQLEEWMVWLHAPGETEPTLWMFADDEIASA